MDEITVWLAQRWGEFQVWSDGPVTAGYVLMLFFIAVVFASQLVGRATHSVVMMLGRIQEKIEEGNREQQALLTELLVIMADRDRRNVDT